MLKCVAGNALPKTVFRFRGCLNAPKIPQATAVASRRYSTVLPAAPDDLALVSLFDQPSRDTSTGTPHTGLFGHANLTNPEAFSTLADATILRARLLTDRILRARESRDELIKVVKNLDRLSDLLCGVIDLAEFIRNAHPDPAWLNSANEAYEKLCEFMNTLNTDVGLYEVLKAFLGDEEIVKSLSFEAHETALIFWRDFERSAIDLPTVQRNRFVSLSSEISVLGRQFLQQTTAARPPISIKASELHGMKDSNMGSRLQSQAEHTLRALKVYPGSLQAHMIMRSVPAEGPRQKVYIATNTSSPEQLDVLERLLRARAQLAQLVGKESYAAITLTDKMAKSPENVQHFLDALLDHTRPHAWEALKTLGTRKQTHLSLSSAPTIQAWDRDFYCPPEPPAPPIPLPPLTLGTVFMGLSRLFRHLYGVSLRPADTTPGEVWHPNVHKLEVVDEDNGIIGCIYPDLFVRRGKASGAAHYTVRCSRRTDLDDVSQDGTVEGQQSLIAVSEEFEAAKRQRVRGQEGEYQLPVVVLMCEFAKPTSKSGPTILEWHEVLTLFHEMGHAMHSMIGRTEYHNVAGTRCATDFVELPSILMEHFLNSPRVLSLFAVEGVSSSKRAGNHHEDPCRSIDTHSQILLAMLDQKYHSPDVLAPTFDSTLAVEQLHNTRGLIPYVPGTSFQTQFGHLYGYGATYYSYLFDRAIASRVWSKVFSRDPLCRETGEKYKREILRPGGGKEPWSMVAALLDAPELEVGDASAMREVGKWRIEDDVSVPGRH